MFSVIATLLGTVIAPSEVADVQVANLPGVFEATCLDGQARLSAGEASAVSFDQLPSDLQKSLGRPASGNVWRLAGGNSYLYVLSYTDSPGVSPKVCGLASDGMDLKTASAALAGRVAGGVERNTSAKTAQWMNAADGYVATATSAGSFKVLQISWMSDADKAAAAEQVAQLPH